MPDSTDLITGWRRIALEWSDVPLRAILAATFILHGHQKVFGGGAQGLASLLEKINVPAPGVMAWVVAIVEFGGGIAIALGFFTRLAGLALAVNMAVAIAKIHYAQGFMMHVGDGRMPQGYEWQAALFCIAFALFIRGAGPFSVDRIFSGYWKRSGGGKPS